MPRTKKSEIKSKFVFAVGRRKEAVARVRLYEGKGEILINNKPVTEYFPGEMAKLIYLKPFQETGTIGKFFVTAKISGGGENGQLEALIHGISRALVVADQEKFRPILKKKGFLTRDARVRERRKVGTGGKARRKKQSPKR